MTKDALTLRRDQLLAAVRAPKDRTAALAARGPESLRAVREAQERDRAPASQIDLAVVVDATGSMHEQLSMIGEKLTGFVGKLSSRYQNLRLSAAFYRDHDRCGEYVIALFNEGASFAPGAEAHRVQDFINAHAVPGDGGGREDMGEALYHVAHLPWTAPIRIVVHIGDQNSHGYDTNPPQRPGMLGDGECRLGLSHDRLLSELLEASVAVFMVQCPAPEHLVSCVAQEYRSIASRTGGKYLRFDELGACEDILLFVEAAIASKSGQDVKHLLSTRFSEGRLTGRSHVALLGAFTEEGI